MPESPRALTRPLALAALAGLTGLFVLLPLAPASAATVNVSIVNFAYNPNPVTVTAGDTILWTQNGAATHTVTADDNSFTSGNMTTGQTFSRTFDTPGTIRYYCTIHGGPNGQGMSGTIVVQAAQATTSSSTTTTTTTTTAAPALATSTTTTTTTAGASSGQPGAETEVLSSRAAQQGETLAATGSRYAGALAAIGAALVLTGAYVLWEIRRMGDGADPGS